MNIPATSLAIGPFSWAYVREEQPVTTAGGTFTTGSWVTRTLNTETDPDGFVTLASNQMTLLPGTYRIKAIVPSMQVSQNVARLFNVTDNVEILTGSGVYDSAGLANCSVVSIIIGMFTIDAGKALEIQHRCAVTFATFGLGWPGNVTTEVYTQVQLWKLV
jgi:hypothetical protein